jgi:hypothetical protein
MRRPPAATLPSDNGCTGALSPNGDADDAKR